MENGDGLIPGGRDMAAGAVLLPLQGLEKGVVVVLPLSRPYNSQDKTSVTPEIGALAPSPRGITSHSASLQKRAVG